MGSKYVLYCIRDLNLHDAVWGLHDFPPLVQGALRQHLAKAAPASPRTWFSKPQYIHTLSTCQWTSFLCRRICCLHSTQMFVSSYCCSPCCHWGCNVYFILNFASMGSLSMCFYNSSCFFLWPFVWCIPISCGGGKGRLFLSSVELKVGFFSGWGFNGSSLLSEFLPEMGHICAERIVIKLAFLQKIESTKPTLMATIMTYYPKG